MRGTFNHIATFIAALSLTGCIPDDEGGTPPSAALFPVTYYGEVPPDFSGRIAQRAPRLDSEFYALLGTHYADTDPAVLASLRDSLEHGLTRSPDGRKTICRVRSPEQARAILGEDWAGSSWVDDSPLAEGFRQYPNATVVVLGLDDQRILFFDSRDRLVGEYPESSFPTGSPSGP